MAAHPAPIRATARLLRASPKYLSYLRLLCAIRSLFMFAVAAIPLLTFGTTYFRSIDNAEEVEHLVCIGLVGGHRRKQGGFVSQLK